LQHAQLKHPILQDHQEHLLKCLQHQTLRDTEVIDKKFIKTNLRLLEDLKPIVLALSSNALPCDNFNVAAHKPVYNTLTIEVDCPSKGLKNNKTYKQ